MRFAIGVFDAVVSAFKAGWRFSPKFLYNLNRLLQLGEAHRRFWKIKVIRPILLLHPTCPDAKEQPSAGEKLEISRHLRQQAGVTVRLAEDAGTKSKRRVGGGKICDRRKTFQV